MLLRRASIPSKVLGCKTGFGASAETEFMTTCKSCLMQRSKSIPSAIMVSVAGALLTARPMLVVSEAQILLFRRTGLFSPFGCLRGRAEISRAGKRRAAIAASAQQG